MSHQTESLEHASVRQYCKLVRTPAIAANFASLAEQAIKEKHSHVRYLEALLAMECEERDRHAVANRIRDAQLPRLKTLDEFDFENVGIRDCHLNHISSTKQPLRQRFDVQPFHNSLKTKAQSALAWLYMQIPPVVLGRFQ